LGLLYYEKGKIEKAMRLLRKSLDCIPSHVNAKKILADIYEELGNPGSAKSLRKDFESTDSKKETSDRTRLTIPPSISKEDARYFLELFKCKEIGYAKQTFDQAGRAYFDYIDELLNIDLVIDHILGKHTLGFYQLRKDRTLNIAIIEAKINPRKVTENLKNESSLVLMEEKLHEYMVKIASACQNTNLPSYLEDGGERNRRLWFFLDEFLPCQLIKRFSDSILKKTPPPPSDIQVETQLGLGGTGVGWEQVPVMLPLGINQKTGKRCLFIDFYGKPHSNQLEYMWKIRHIGAAEVKELLSSANRKLRKQYSTFHEQPEFIEAIYHKCPVLGEIINKARSGRSLSRQEKLILYYTIGMLEDKQKSIHYVLENTPEYRPQRVDRLVSQLKTNPISCPKIRELLPEVTAYVKCDCAFRIPEGGYPSPLIHVNPKLVENRRDKLLTSPQSLQEAARRYVSIYRELQGLKKSLAKLERAILPLLEQKNVSNVPTPLGCLKKVVNGERFHLVVEL